MATVTLRYRLCPYFVADERARSGVHHDLVQTRVFLLSAIAPRYRDAAVRYAQLAHQWSSLEWPLLTELGSAEQIIEAWVETEAARISAPDDLSELS